MTTTTKSPLPKHKIYTVGQDKIVQAMLHEEGLQIGQKFEVVFRKPRKMYKLRVINKPQAPNYNYQTVLINKCIATKLFEAALIYKWVLLEYALKHQYWLNNGKKNWPERGNYSSWKFIQNKAHAGEENGQLLRATIYHEAKEDFLVSLGQTKNTVVKWRNAIVHNGEQIDEGCFNQCSELIDHTWGYLKIDITQIFK